ncbi:hypothetical protein QFC19_008208 [Naganishia cerealis]|uniref:Uncharacterized protein n=1 Tax=Naganishia cerealis TaxID=610337 RepID=A0ACC2V3K9_9TREE|nr:hypothetical protein QFC19_008208 [Naganishia cerealis]
MDQSTSPPPQPSHAAAPSTPSPHPGIAHAASAPVMPTATGTPLLPSQQEPSSSGMSMTDLLSKLSQTASTPANNAPQPFPPAPTSAAAGPGGYPPPMNGGGGGNQHHLHPGNGLSVPETLQHANSWSVGQVPSPHSMAGTSSPQRMPAPHPMGSMSSPQPPNNVPPHVGTANHAVDLTASLKQMLGLGTSSSPTHHRAPTNTVNGPPMAPVPQYVNAPMQPHLMTPTRRFDDPRSLHHPGGGGATPPPIHLAPALDMNGRSHSPLQASSVHRPMSQPPSRQLSQHQLQTNSPRNTTTNPVTVGHSGLNDTQPRPRPNQGYIPNPGRNNDPFTIGSTSAGAGAGANSTTQTLDTDRLTHAVVDTWNHHQPGFVKDHHTPDENDKEQKRDFVRALLSAIHVSSCPSLVPHRTPNVAELTIRLLTFY